MRVEAERRFPVSVRDGFGYITDQANWPDYWPNLVRIEPGSRWSEPGDVTRIVLHVLRRDVELTMTLHHFEPHRLVEYTSTQDGLPDMRHERHFSAAGESLHYRVVVEFEPRGLYDRVIVRAAVARTVKRTIANLDKALVR
jgi:hypothetical protein